MIQELEFLTSSLDRSTSVSSIPIQMVGREYKYGNLDSVTKVPKWVMQNADAYERIAINQFEYKKRTYKDNEKLANGLFAIPTDYVPDCTDCLDSDNPLAHLIKTGDAPYFMKHYDIISYGVDIMVNEFDQLPYSLNVVGRGEVFESDLEKQKIGKIRDYVIKMFDAKVGEALKAKIEITGEETDEEKMQIMQEIAKAKDDMTPDEFKQYMRFDLRHIAELWGDFELTSQEQRFDLKRMRRTEFRQKLIFGDWFRILNYTPNGLEPRNIHPLFGFGDIDGDHEWYQDGQYAGVSYFLNTSDLIHLKGKYFTEEQLKQLDNKNESFKNTDAQGADSTIRNILFPQSNIDTQPYAKYLGLNQDVSLFDILGSKFFSSSNNWRVTEVYWWAYKRISKLNWINPKTGLHEIKVVSEDFVKPHWIKEINSDAFVTSSEINTIKHTWQLEQWQATKVTSSISVNSSNTVSMYIDYKPVEYQANFNYNNKNKKLLVCGEINRKREGKTKVFIDQKKNHQYVYNILMNNGMKLIERSYLPYVEVDLKGLPDYKDTGPSSAVMDYFDIGQKLGATPVDRSSNNNPNQPAVPPRLIDLDLTPRISMYYKLAQDIKNLSDAQLGFTPSRLNDIEGIDSATGISMSTAKIYASTSSYFTSYLDCERDIMKLQLDIEQHFQSKNDTIQSSFTKSDFTKAFLKFNKENFSLYDLGLYIDDSQKKLKNLQLIKTAALQNTSSLNAMDRMDILLSESDSTVRAIMKAASEKEDQMRQQVQQIEQMKINAKTEAEKVQYERELVKLKMKIDGEIKKAFVVSRGYLQAGEQDLNQDTLPDAFNYEEFQQKANDNLEKSRIANEKIEIEKEKLRLEDLNKAAELAMKNRALDLKELSIQQSGINSALFDKGKYIR